MKKDLDIVWVVNGQLIWRGRIKVGDQEIDIDADLSRHLSPYVTLADEFMSIKALSFALRDAIVFGDTTDAAGEVVRSLELVEFK